MRIFKESHHSPILSSVAANGYVLESDAASGWLTLYGPNGKREGSAHFNDRDLCQSLRERFSQLHGEGDIQIDPSEYINEAFDPLSAILKRDLVQDQSLQNPFEDNPDQLERWSSNQEDFDFSSLDDLLDSNDELTVGDTVYIGTGTKPSPSRFLNMNHFLDSISNAAIDIGGELAEDILDPSEQDINELKSYIENWLTKHCNINFYEIVNIREHVLTEQDMEDRILDATIDEQTDLRL